MLKHSILALVIDYLQRKETPLFILDTHAGRGVYDLAGRDALKTGEWQQGIGRIQSSSADAEIELLVKPYRDALASFNKSKEWRFYPGSSALLRARLRPHDRAVFCEAHREEAARLRQHCAGDSRVRVVEGDGYHELARSLPPSERRGLVLIDPPYEALDEYSSLAAALDKALRRFANGVYMVWYPLTATAAPLENFLAAMSNLHLPKTLRIEMMVRPREAEGLNGCGLLVINQPHLLENQLRTLLPWLVRMLADGNAGSFHLSSLP